MHTQSPLVRAAAAGAVAQVPLETMASPSLPRGSCDGPRGHRGEGGGFACSAPFWHLCGQAE
eukprot:13830038-Alexandrium_andersonii.AAC.1